MGDRVEGTVLRLAYDVLAILITVAVAMLIGWLVEGLKKVQEELTAPPIQSACEFLQGK